MNFKTIEFYVNSVGLLYLLTAILILFYKKGKKYTSIALWLCTVQLIFLAFCYMKGKSFAIGQFWEYSIQFSLPILLWLWVQQKITPQQWLTVAKVCIALTFTCHGLYAVGFYPIPGNFIDMTIAITGLNQANTYVYLMAAGILDFILAVGIFAPNHKLNKYLLAYACFWGVATSSARIFAYATPDYFWSPFWQWLPHAVYRLPHGLLPFVAILVLQQYQKAENSPLKLSVATSKG